LPQKPTLLVVSKLDLPDAQERLTELRAQFPDIRGISSATGEGVKDLVYAAWTAIQHAPIPEIVTPEPAKIHLRPNEPFGIHKEDETFVITGERVERLAAMTNFDSDEGLARFEQILAKMGVDKKLRELGAVEGDTVRIGPYEFTYS
jgi:GTP-binding protein